MRKICLALILVLMIAVPGWAKYWYAAPSGTNGDGSESSPWVGFSNIVWGSGGVDAGDTLWLMPGTYSTKQLYLQNVNGTSSSWITVRGDYNGGQAVISLIKEITGWDTASNWTEESTNVWYLDISSLAAPNPFRLWIDNDEKERAQDKASLDTTHMWWYDSTNKYLYIYSSANPATSFSSMKGLQANVENQKRTVLLDGNCSYIRFTGIKMEGSHYGFIIENSHHIIVDNCIIGWNGYQAIHLRNDCYNVTITGCIVDSNSHLSYSYESDSTGDGVNLLDGSHDCIVRNCIVKDWEHGGVACSYNGGYGGNAVYDNIIEFNDISAPDVQYSRPIATGGASEGNCHDNVYRCNKIHNYGMNPQIQGNANRIIYNLFYDVFNSTATTQSRGISLQGYQLSKDNVVANNTFYHIAGAGIYVNPVTGNSGNQVTNNIFIDCGYDSDNGMDNIGIQIVDAPEDVTIDNNCIYDADTNLTVYYKSDGAITVATLNSKSTASNNIASNPLLTSTYHLTHNSPCIDAGTKVTGIHDQDDWKDLDGHIIHYGSNPDIGCYEYNTNFIKRWGRAKWNIGKWGRGKWGGARW